MDTFLKILSLVMAGCAAALLLWGSEFRRLASLCCLMLCGILALRLLEPVLRLLEQLGELAGISEAVFAPVLRGTAIGILTETASAFCRDAGEQALSSALEFGGVLAILYVSLPLFQAAIGLLGTLMEG